VLTRTVKAAHQRSNVPKHGAFQRISEIAVEDVSGQVKWFVWADCTNYESMEQYAPRLQTRCRNQFEVTLLVICSSSPAKGTSATPLNTDGKCFEFLIRLMLEAATCRRFASKPWASATPILSRFAIPLLQSDLPCH